MHAKVERLQEKIQRGDPLLVTLSILLGSTAGAAMGLLAVETELPLFLDSIGTALVAALFGAFPGMLTGLLTNLLVDLYRTTDSVFLSFAPVNMVTGFLVGYCAWRFDLSRPGTVAALIALVSVTNVVLGTATVVWIYSGTTATSIDYLVTALLLTGRSLFSSAFLARIPTNLVDKTIALVVAYGAYRWAFTPFRGRRSAVR